MHFRILEMTTTSGFLAALIGKGSPYSIAELRVPELIWFLAVSQQVT